MPKFLRGVAHARSSCADIAQARAEYVLIVFAQFGEKFVLEVHSDRGLDLRAALECRPFPLNAKLGNQKSLSLARMGAPLMEFGFLAVQERQWLFFFGVAAAEGS